MALFHFSAKVLSRSSRNTVRAIAYRAGCTLYDAQTGQTFAYQNKEVPHVELLLPKDAPSWAKEIQLLIIQDRQKGIQALVDVVEAAEKRIDAQVWREFEFALHRELTDEQNIALAREFVQDQICGQGMMAQLNFHFDRDEKTGEYKPHCHVVVTTRRIEEQGLSPKKETAWNKKTYLLALREQWAQYSNFHLKLHGHNARIDHRSYHELGIEVEPQPKRGRSVSEQESRSALLQLKSDAFTSLTATEKGREFHSAHLRNLYRLLRNPEIVFEIVSKHHATFMWADVQKVLHRYIDEERLFQKMEARLKNSSELVLLRLEPSQAQGGIEEQAVYTTQKLLKAEKALVTYAEELNKIQSHQIAAPSVATILEKANQKLQESGISSSLSEDQITAIHHFTNGGQLKCGVGIAGAGKTTALGICQEIWKSNDYAVYGLTPTGKAAQNLEQSGISSSTLHKFLKSFEEGRCHYNPKTVLVLDEGGMVDIGRFSELLRAVKQLEVKLVVVGDGSQLQPVEAGPAFRLITECLGKVELTTVLRQKENWQKEATRLFGRQQTQEAIQRYQDKGCIHIIEEHTPSLTDALASQDVEKLRILYDMATRVSSRMYREIVKNGAHFSTGQHPDYASYLQWKSIEKVTAPYIHQEKPLLLQKVDMRQATKEELLKRWHADVQSDPGKSSLILAFSNRDVKDLNTQARVLLKRSGRLEKEDIFYKTAKDIKDDFGTRRPLIETKPFSKGDRIVFTRNNYDLKVKNGTLGIITKINKALLQVKLDHEERVISFAPDLNPFFDHGWALTIHKSQGTTTDKTYVLASYEMTQNLTYVAMTRHRESVHVFGSSLDFSRPEKLPEILSKSGEKLASKDYLDSPSLEKLIKQEDRFLSKLFTRLSDELEAIGAVSKQAFWKAADRFLVTPSSPEIRIPPISKREETRAEELRQEQKLSAAAQTPTQYQAHPPRIDVKSVEEALKSNLSVFADEVLSSLGIFYNSSASSSTERRYGKKGHIAVNLKTGAWIDYKNSDMAGGPLHILTKLKGLSFKEALEYGASWAEISQLPVRHSPLKFKKEAPLQKDELPKETEAKIKKAQALWAKGEPLAGTIAERYLRETRKIEGPLSDILRYLPRFKDKGSGAAYPCLMAAAQASQGEITAVQLTFLDPQTAKKAEIETPKRSYGFLKGSSVIVQEDKDASLLFIAEGVETALSLKSANIQGTIKASLGISNMKRLAPETPETKMIICADHDAPHSPARLSLEKSIIVLQEKGFSVAVIKPDKIHEDFNDVLKKEGPQKVKETIEKALSPPVSYENVSANTRTTKQTFWQKIKGSFSEKSGNATNLPQEVSSSVLSDKKENPGLYSSQEQTKNLSLPYPSKGPSSISEELRRKMMGNEFYNRTHHQQIAQSSSKEISEELKKTMLGDELYAKAYAKPEARRFTEAERVSKAHSTLDIREDHLHPDHETNIIQKPTFRGRRR